MGSHQAVQHSLYFFSSELGWAWFIMLAIFSRSTERPTFLGIIHRPEGFACISNQKEHAQWEDFLARVWPKPIGQDLDGKTLR